MLTDLERLLDSEYLYVPSKVDKKDEILEIVNKMQGICLAISSKRKGGEAPTKPKWLELHLQEKFRKLAYILHALIDCEGNHMIREHLIPNSTYFELIQASPELVDVFYKIFANVRFVRKNSYRHRTNLLVNTTTTTIEDLGW